MTMPARRRTSSSGRSPRPPSDYRDPPPQQQPEFDASETDPNGVAAAADIAVYRVRNFTTKSGSVINRGDSIKVRRGHKTAAAAEDGSARVSRRASSDSASRDRRDLVSRQSSRVVTDHDDSDGVSPSTAAASLLPDGQDDGGQASEDDLAASSAHRRAEDIEVYKVLVFGSQGVGKTTLVEQLMTSEYLANKDNSFMGQCCFLRLYESINVP